MSREFAIDNSVMLLTMAALVAVTGAGVPAWARRLRTARWALVLPVPICAVVAGIAAVPDSAKGLTWLALVGVPIGAVLALGWGLRGARPWMAVGALPLLVLAFGWHDTPAGDFAALALSALSCVALGRALAGVTPLTWLKLGLVALASIDAVLVFGEALQQPNSVLTAAAPGPGLPQLQYAHVGRANLGYGDLFAAAVLGAIVAVERRPPLLAAALTLALCEAFTLMFYVVDSLPMTVPVAVALLVLEAVRGRFRATPVLDTVDWAPGRSPPRSPAPVRREPRETRS